MKIKHLAHNTRLCALAADVHLAVFAPAFTLSFHDSECSRKPPMPLASGVSSSSKKITATLELNTNNRRIT